uniref:C2H2-type domain-containing protein n=1 Tax=Glossina pallidipes TaxID=7398 RepID=A0A1B0A567_GLOPL
MNLTSYGRNKDACARVRVQHHVERGQHTPRCEHEDFLVRFGPRVVLVAVAALSQHVLVSRKYRRPLQDTPVLNSTMMLLLLMRGSDDSHQQHRQNSPNTIADEQPSCSNTSQIHYISPNHIPLNMPIQNYQSNNNTLNQNPSRFHSDTSCRVCGRTFTTKTGVGVHMRRAHSDEHDQQKARTDVKQRWSEEEESLLARKEAELTAIGTQFMNEALAPLFPSRSLEAIKKARQKETYHKRVQEYIAMQAEGNQVGEVPQKSEVRNPPSGLSEAVTEVDDHLRELLSMQGENPGDFRPITIPSVMVRQLHGILAKRITEALELGPRQRAFLPTDGTGDNAVLLDIILKAVKAKFHCWCMALLDVSKAFDSVSHNTIRTGLRSIGIPENFILYLEEYCKSASTVLMEDGIIPKRGVKQGGLGIPCLRWYVPLIRTKGLKSTTLPNNTVPRVGEGDECKWHSIYNKQFKAWAAWRANHSNQAIRQENPYLGGCDLTPNLPWFCLDIPYASVHYPIMISNRSLTHNKLFIPKFLFKNTDGPKLVQFNKLSVLAENHQYFLISSNDTQYNRGGFMFSMHLYSYQRSVAA